MEIQVGMRGQAETVVTTQNTADSVGSGLLPVFATPSMIALMEEAAVKALNLEGTASSVGIAIDIRHLAATPLAMKVWAEAEVIEVDRRRVVFNVFAYDEREKIGEGRHERFLIDSEQFMRKVAGKRV